MNDKLYIRSATPADAKEISSLIIQTLTETNAQDYPNSVITEVIKNFSEDNVLMRMEQRRTFVITDQEKIIGTASLEAKQVKTVFILPSEQGKNAGTLLMKHLENIARKENIDCLTVPSSITAEGFYRKLGYKLLRNEYYGEERIIIMEKKLSEIP